MFSTTYPQVILLGIVLTGIGTAMYIYKHTDIVITKSLSAETAQMNSLNQPLVDEQFQIEIPTSTNPHIATSTLNTPSATKPTPKRTAPIATPKIITNSTTTVTTNSSLATYTTATIATYNGSDPDLPIYIAFQGNVYDVTAGKEFYETGAVYNFLAGTDGTPLLESIGGDIIKRKYPVVGTFTP